MARSTSGSRAQYATDPWDLKGTQGRRATPQNPQDGATARPARKSQVGCHYRLGQKRSETATAHSEVQGPDDGTAPARPEKEGQGEWPHQRTLGGHHPEADPPAASTDGEAVSLPGPQRSEMGNTTH